MPDSVPDHAPTFQNYIDGAVVGGGAGAIDVTDPATGEVVGTQALADAGDVDRAVNAAARLHRERTLRDMRPIERGRMVQAMGQYLTAHREEIARLLTLEQGKPIWESLIEVDGAARVAAAAWPPGSTASARGSGAGGGALASGASPRRRSGPCR